MEDKVVVVVVSKWTVHSTQFLGCIAGLTLACSGSHQLVDQRFEAHQLNRTKVLAGVWLPNFLKDLSCSLGKTLFNDISGYINIRLILNQFHSVLLLT